MKKHYKILLSVVVLAIALGVGYGAAQVSFHNDFQIIYSLDRKQNDQAIVDLINDADKYVYFAIYTFTKENIADALIAAHRRGLEVRGIADRDQSAEDFQKPIISKLTESGVDMVTQKHPDGIMHIKAVVTDHGYASGSYNWTASATTVNDEILEVGTNKYLHDQYLSILKKVLADNQGSEVAVANTAASDDSNNESKTYSYTEAGNHIGETAMVSGKVVEVFTSATNTTFFDYCSNYKSCPFSAVIFASAKSKFPNVLQYQGKEITIKGLIKSYQGHAEIILDSPDQIIYNKVGN